MSMMAIRICHFLLWLGVAVNASSQTLEHLQKGVVRVTATTSDGSRKEGSGFIVRLTGGSAHIVTASHVVEGAAQVEVEFFTQRARPLTAKIVELEGGDPQGLAALSLTGNVPDGVSVLRLNPAAPVNAGDPVTIIGFPRAGGPWAVTKGEIVGRKAKAIVFTGGIDEGSSGSPLIRDGQVIGVVSEARPPFAYAVPATIVRYVLDNWGVKFREELRSQPAKLTAGNIVNMIREKRFHHPGDQSKDGLSGSVIGSFPHEYEAKTIAGDKVVIDHATGLMWQQSGSSDGLSLETAEAYVGELNREGFAGFLDWRLPTIEELASLMEPIGKNDGLFVDPAFDSRQKFLRSADGTDTDIGQRGRWLAGFYDGAIHASDGPSGWAPNVRAVRAMSLDAPASDSGAATGKAKPPPVSARLRDSRIAFASERDGNSEIHVMNADGSGQIRLTHGAARNLHPAWSPDGSRIAFVSEPKSDRFISQVHVMNADGSGGKRLTPPAKDYFAPSWAPDGERIAVYTLDEDEGEPGLLVIDADGAAKVMRLADSNMGMITQHQDTARSSWSPDGKRIAFTARGDGFLEIRVVNTQEPGKTVALWQGQGNDYYSPAWSPDGKRIAFVSRRDGNAEIYVIDADGANPKRLTHNAAGDLWPCWSPDGAKIAFASQRYGNWEIYMMDADGANAVRLTDSPEEDTQPSWSPFLK